MAELQNHQFELLPSEQAADGFVFGIFSGVTVENAGFDSGSRTIRSQDRENPTSDGVLFGTDLNGGQTWAWNMSTDGETIDEALQLLATARSAWRGDRVRREPGAVQVLRYRIGDRTRRVYGRSRRFAAPPDNLILGGYVPITADFQCVDDLHYDDVEQSATVQLFSVSTGGGLTTPLISPLTTLAGGAPRGGVVDTSAGDVDTWAVVEIAGEALDPWVQVDFEGGGGWRLQVNGSMNYDDRIVIDPRPWRRMVLNQYGASAAGRLGRGLRLADLTLPPGRHEMTFGNRFSASTATATVRWRTAHSSL